MRKVGSMRRTSGFTLIEVIIVLLIIGIASGLVGIFISKGSGGLKVKTFTREISTVLRYARNHAVSEKKIYCFVIDKNEQMFRLYAEDIGYKKISPVMSRQIPEDLEMTLQGSDEESPHIEFSPFGNSSGGVVQINNDKGTTFLISVNRITGRVDIERSM